MRSDLSTMQIYGSFPAETSVSLDGAAPLLRLAGRAQELGAHPVAAFQTAV